MYNFNSTLAKLRGLSILVVILMHYATTLKFPFSLEGPLGNGYFGVIVFFVISGYLITSHSLREHPIFLNKDIFEFYRKRIARIFPVLFLFLFIASFLSQFNLPNFHIESINNLFYMILAALTFHYNKALQNSSLYLVYGWVVLWSLSIEEVFYLSFPVARRLILSRAAIIVVLILIVIAGPICRACNYVGSSSMFDYFACFDGIALGSLVAIIKAQKPVTIGRIARRLVISGCIAVMCAGYFFLNSSNYIIAPMVMAYPTAAIALVSSEGDGPRSYRWSLPVLVGNTSYEIYLFHLPVFSILAFFMRNNIDSLEQQILFCLFSLALVFIVSAAIVQFYSDPARLWIMSYSKAASANYPGFIRRYMALGVLLVVITVPTLVAFSSNIKQLFFPEPIVAIAYGPETFHVGESPNVQPDGQALLWIRFNHPLPSGTSFKANREVSHAWFDGNNVAVALSRAFCNSEGKKKIEVLDRFGNTITDLFVDVKK